MIEEFFCKVCFGEGQDVCIGEEEGIIGGV